MRNACPYWSATSSPAHPPDPGPVRAAGHPLLGDGKYGRERDNKQYGRSYQALYSYKLRFEFTTDAGCLNELNGREWTVKDVDFVSEYFPDYPIGCP